MSSPSRQAEAIAQLTEVTGGGCSDEAARDMLESVDWDVQRAADDGVRGFRMYGQRGRGYGEGGSGHDAYDDPYDAPAAYDTHG